MNLISFNCKVIHTNLKKTFKIKFIYNNNVFYPILKTLEKNNISINYQCRSGYCGSCRVILKKGSIQYHKYPLASRIFSREIFVCCCYPIEDIVLKI